MAEPGRYEVAVGSGSLFIDDGYALPHAWTGAGVTVEAAFSGAHLLHLAVAGCVLNDVYREARRLGHSVDGVRVTAHGGFDDDWASTGISYTVALDSALAPAEVAELLDVVEREAEIPQALRAGAAVTRVGS